MKTTIKPAVVKEKTITVEMTVEDAAVVAAIIGQTQSGKKYTDTNTCVYALFNDLANFIDGEGGKDWNEHIRRYVNVGQSAIRLN